MRVRPGLLPEAKQAKFSRPTIDVRTFASGGDEFFYVAQLDLDCEQGGPDRFKTLLGERFPFGDDQRRQAARDFVRIVRAHFTSWGRNSMLKVVLPAPCSRR
jgi:hypothetical protein